MTYSRYARFFTNSIRSVLLIVALIGGNFLTPTTAHAAATYYVSSSDPAASDTNTGTSSSAPWKTLAKVNTFLASASHVAGDSILFKRGDTFYATPGSAGAIVLTKNGTSAARITLGAYGTGAKPVISGFAPITSGWTSVGTNLWEITAPTGVNNMSTMVMNGTVMPLGRYPDTGTANGGYATMTYSSATGANVTFTGPTGTISALGNLAGAEVVFRPNHWTAARGIIGSTSGDTITLAQRASTYSLANGLGFFIQNSSGALNQNGEWAYIAATGKIRLYYAGTPPTTYFSSVDKLVSLGGFDYVTVSNLVLEGAKYNAIDGNAAAFITVDSNDITYAGQFGAYFNGGNDVTFTNNTITDAQNTGIYVRSASGNNFTISYNTLTRIGKRMGTQVPNTTGNNLDGMSVTANNMTIEGNRLDGIGDNGIRFNGSTVTIKRNVIKNFNEQLDDGGGIYTYGGGNTVANPSVTQYSNRTITENIISQGYGAPYGTSSSGRQSSGIYLDNNSNHIDITNNTIFDTVNKGVPLNSIQNIKVSGNTFFNTANGSLGICRWINDGSQPNGGQEPVGNSFTNNVFFNISDDQDLLSLCDYGIKETNPTNTATYPDKISSPGSTLASRMQAFADATKGGFNNNIYRSVNPTPIAIGAQDTTSGPWINRLPLTVALWSRLSGHDTTSTVVPVTKYILNGTLANLFTNSTVDTLTGLTSSGSTSTLSLDTTGQITGANSAKITVTTAPSATNYSYKTYTVWAGLNAPITATKKYLVRFKTRGTTDNGLVKVSLYRKSGTWAYLTPSQYGAFGTDVTQHEFMFTGATASGTGVNGSVLIELLEASGTTYIDDIQVIDADATIIEPNANVVFEYNDTATTKTVALPVGTYYNIRDTTQTTPIVGTATVPAFSSVVLVKPVSAGTDTIAPTVALTSPVAGSVINGVVTLSATATDNVGVSRVDFYQGATLVGTSAAAPYTASWNTTSVANGTYNLTAVAVDSSGNSATSTSSAVTVANPDITAPTVSLTAPTAGSVSATVALSATAADNIGVASVSFYYGTTLIGTDTTSPYSASWNTTSIANGSYILKAVATDAAGNSTTSTTVTVTVANADTTAPVVSITSPAAASTLSGITTIAASATDNVAITSVSFYHGTTLIGTDTTAPYTTSWNTTSVANGVYNVKAIATDSSGNQTTSSLVAVTIGNADTTAPSVSLTAPTGGTISGVATLSATAADNIGVAAVDFYYGTVLISTDTTAPYSVSWSTTTVTNGSYVLKAVARDAAGNSATSSTVSVTVSNIVADTVAPTVALTGPTVGSTLAGTVTLAATATDNVGVSRVDFYVGSTLMASDTTAPYTATWNTLLSINGSFRIKAFAYDAAGNSATNDYLVTVANGTSGISTVITSPVSGTTVSGTIAVTATVTGSNITKVDFYKDADVTPFATLASSYTTFLNTATLTNGSHTLKAIAYTSSGASSVSPSVVVTVSNTTGGIGGGTTTGTPDAPTAVVAQAGYSKVKISWAPPASNGGSAISSYTVTAAPGGATVNSTGSPVVFSNLSNGTTYTFSVRANNSAGAGIAATSNLVSPTTAFPVGSQVVVNVSSSLTVRRTAGGGRIGSVVNGTIGTVLDTSAGWTQVQFPSITGWVSSTYLFSR